ncbi:MAG: HIT domain-containing protein [Neisseria sp.]|nr:HIT domain-containing protein [Neisseria sp.]
MNCPLCSPSDETVLWQNHHLRVIAVNDDANAPAFCRVIWQQHVAEMSDLSADDRAKLMNTVYALEVAMREVLQPAKINLASLGNVVPHLHWHVIARFTDDACFPASIWAPPQRTAKIRLPENWQQSIATLLTEQLS